MSSFYSNLADDSEEYFYQEEHLQQTLNLEGFEGLWQATESTLPLFDSHKTDSEKVIEEQREQILFLADELGSLRNENFELRQEMANLVRKSEMFEKVCQDYSHLIELNRSLTKQLNSIMSQREKEQAQIQALRNLLS
ncbi:MAG: hypothetical protein QNJ31_00865 [Candidatus Caenarcaniphilales bacterium]|nr:hypothetical protein [Candidatus Caenarcaniphilales bacterium]